MNQTVTFILDGKVVQARGGQSILAAAESAGTYIPRLCAHPELTAHGSCRVCVVKLNGRLQPACIQPVADGMVVESATDELRNIRAGIVEMLLVEGNHFCMFCEKSGACELQALAYRFGVTAPRHPFFYQARSVDASHPDLLLDHNRCILCGRCVRASGELDGKGIFEFVGRGRHKRVAVNSAIGLGGTPAEVSDRAVALCPVGAILPKRQAFRVPVGQRPYDHSPIGSEVEEGRGATPE